MTQVQVSRPSEQGFTLVELAIVMVIIGLLIGGILKGQELIANAKVGATVSQLKGLDAGINTFQDKYNAKPGDMIDATTRLSGCVAPCVNGNGNGRIATSLAAPTANGDESVQVFVHLSAADLVSGIDSSGTGNIFVFGKALPVAKAGGGLWIGYADTAPGSTTLATGKQYAVLNGTVTSYTATSGGLSASTAAQIDRKLDDGIPYTGSVQTDGTGCVTGTAYDEAQSASTCAMFSRVLN